VLIPDVKFDGTQVSGAGTITFASDMTWTGAFQRTGSFTFSLPSSCMVAGTTCNDRCAQAAPYGKGTGTATADGGCTCADTVSDSIRLSGIYSTTGSGGLNLNGPQPGSYSIGQFCVQGNALVLAGDRLAIPSWWFASGVFVRQ
jgi:hypothetical protein